MLEHSFFLFLTKKTFYKRKKEKTSKQGSNNKKYNKIQKEHLQKIQQNTKGTLTKNTTKYQEKNVKKRLTILY